MTENAQTDICPMKITGRTKLLAILADPVVQVRAPAMINTKLEETRRDAVMVPLHVVTADLRSVMFGLKALQNFYGAVITMPHKPAIVHFLSHATPAVQQVSACNVIRRCSNGDLIGDMLDGEAFVAALQGRHGSVSGASALVLGAGGTASAIAFALIKHGVQQLVIANRTHAKAEALAASIRREVKNADVRAGRFDPGGHDLIVNATSVGMNPSDPPLIEADRIGRDAIVADVVIEPEITPLLQAAQERGCHVHPGRPMLAAQIDLMIEFMLRQE